MFLIKNLKLKKCFFQKIILHTNFKKYVQFIIFKKRDSVMKIFSSSFKILLIIEIILIYNVNYNLHVSHLLSYVLVQIGYTFFKLKCSKLHSEGYLLDIFTDLK